MICMYHQQGDALMRLPNIKTESVLQSAASDGSEEIMDAEEYQKVLTAQASPLKQPSGNLGQVSTNKYE